MKVGKLFRHKCGIYKIENTVNNKTYIGSSRDVYNRLHAHRACLRGSKHTNTKLQNSWNKYGEDSFICTLIHECSKEALTIMEQEFIDSLNPEYNITKEVIRNTPSEESRKKQSATARYQWNNGIRVSATNKAVNQYNIYGLLINTFDSVELAAKAAGCHRCTIDRVTTGTKVIGAGYQWRLVDSIHQVVDVSRTRAGRVALYKLGELLETQETDNQQPSALGIE